MAQAEVRYDEGLWIITIPKGMVVLTGSELIRGLRRGKWYQRRQLMWARRPLADERLSASTCISEEASSRMFGRES
jgi:hypothetical protein